MVEPNVKPIKDKIHARCRKMFVFLQHYLERLCFKIFFLHFFKNTCWYYSMQKINIQFHLNYKMQFYRYRLEN